MIQNLVRRAERITVEAQARQLRAVESQLRRLLRGASIEIEDGRVLVRGKGIIRRWLTDPSLRFLKGDLA